MTTMSLLVKVCMWVLGFYTTSLLVLSIWWEPVFSVVYDGRLPYNIFSIVVDCLPLHNHVTKPPPPKFFFLFFVTFLISLFQSKFGDPNIGDPFTCVHYHQPHPLLQTQYCPIHVYVCMPNICPPHAHHRGYDQIGCDIHKSVTWLSQPTQ